MSWVKFDPAVELEWCGVLLLEIPQKSNLKDCQKMAQYEVNIFFNNLMYIFEIFIIITYYFTILFTHLKNNCSRLFVTKLSEEECYLESRGWKLPVSDFETCVEI